MSENNNILDHFEQKGTATKTGLKWGLNLEGVTLADLSVTWGLQGKANLGLSTALYVSPLVAVIGATGLYAMAASISTALKIGGAAAWTGIKAATATVAGHVLKFPAYMTMEIGSKWDCIVGYKKDYVTHIASKTVGGEWGECYGDKIEYYHANLYKYVSGTEFKIELKGEEPKLPTDLTRSQLIGNYTTYADSFEKYIKSNKSVVSEDSVSQAARDNILVAGRYMSLDGMHVSISGGDTVETTCNTMTLGAMRNIVVCSDMGKITLQSGGNVSVEVSAAETKINNKLSLGMLGLGAPVNVASELAKYQQQVAQLQLELAAAKTKAAGAKAEFSARLLAAMAGDG